ncbi:MAG: amidohydrolase [Clostridiales bacterium]
MLLKDISILNEDFEIKDHYYLGIKGRKIEYIGTKMPEDNFGEIFEGKDKLVMPAFYNAHAHTPMTILRGYGENMILQDWLFKKIFPFEAHLNEESVYYAALLGIGEMFRGGCVAATDMYKHGESIAKAFIDSGAKVNLSIGTICLDDSSYYDIKDYAENEHLFAQYHQSQNQRIKIDMSIHGEYTSSPKVVAEVADYAQKKGSRIQVHISETEAEHLECIERHGKTPVGYFNDLGLFDMPTTAAHCVWISPEDMEILAEKGVFVGHCPVSNLKLASGFADIPTMLKKGVSVALGTDGAASNNNLSMLEELKIFALIHKGNQKNPLLITPQEALFTATRSGALSQGRDDCGLVKEGFCADLAVIDMNKPHLVPKEHILSHLVYSAQDSDVFMTICDGKIVYCDGKYPTMDMEKIMAEVNKRYNLIKEKVNQ